MTDLIKNIGTINNYQKFPHIGLHLTEPASSPAAWRFYRRLYTHFARQQQMVKFPVSEGFTLDAPTTQLDDRQYLCYVAAPRREGTDSTASSVQVGGTTIFNFDDAAVHELFKRGKFHRIGDLFIDKLFFCRGMVNSPLNMTLTPEITGFSSLQQGLDVDEDCNIVFDSPLSRFDTFLYLLYQYYLGKQDVLLQNVPRGRLEIANFLNLFIDDQGAYASVWNFCHDVYLLDLTDVEVRYLVTTGSEPIVDDDGVWQYCNHADRYWRKRAENIDRIMA